MALEESSIVQPDEMHKGRHVLVVDDDVLFRESLQQNLTDAGFLATVYPDGPSVIAALRGGLEADLMLLDWKMPEMTGIQVLRSLRESSYAIPVIFLTVLSDQIYEEAALIGGAVDFIEKSRSFSILLKRIDLILAGPKGGAEGQASDPRAAAQQVRIGALELRRDSHRAAWLDTELPLTINEFRIVDLLASRAGQDVGYREIYDIVRGEGFVAGQGPDGHRQNVRTFVKRIRQKFRDVDNTFDRIENYPGFGYRWRGDDG
jgi:two-component system response regulator ChvI